MKLEKREITLNEYDSLEETYYFQKTLLKEYAELLCHVSRKETRGAVLRLMTETGEDLSLVADLMQGSLIENQ